MEVKHQEAVNILREELRETIGKHILEGSEIEKLNLWSLANTLKDAIKVLEGA